MTPSAAYSLLYIASDDKNTFISEPDDNNTGIPELLKDLSIDVLNAMGLVEISDESDPLLVEVTEELYEFAGFINDTKKTELIKQSYRWENIIMALISLYGVADLEILHKFLCTYLKEEIEYEILEKKVFLPMAYWGDMDVLTGNNKKIATLFSENETELILSERNNYDVDGYKTYGIKELSIMITDGIIGFTSIRDLAEYLMFDKQIDPSKTALFISELSTACLQGVSRDNILEMCEENLDEYSLKLTKKIKSLILNVIEQHPCSVLMGYSWDEYNKKDIVIDNQISFFDDLGDSPF